MEFQVLKGTHDVIQDEASKYTYIEDLLTQVARLYNFQEFRTPVIEKSELFLRSVGESSDIVRKEMYDFLDKGGRSITLRPEFTAGIIRSIVNAKLYATQDLPIKAFYVGPVFRYDRPQQGRYRQFNQFGVELVGTSSYLNDVEIISFGYTCLNLLGLKNISLKINTLGDDETRKNYKEALKNYFQEHINDMCEDCKERIKINPLRILDCKVAHDQEYVEKAPKIKDYLSENSKKKFDQILKLLDELKIKYEVDDTLVRGLDYYSDVVFEYHYTSKIGNNYGAIGAGGHYANLVSEMNGPSLEGVGLSFGIERLFNILNDDEKEFELPHLDVVFMPLFKDEEHLNRIYNIVEKLRLYGYSSEMLDFNKSIKSMFKIAQNKGAKFAIIIGEEEFNSNTVNIKNLEEKTQETINLSDLVMYLDGSMEQEEHHHDECCGDECCCHHHHE